MVASHKRSHEDAQPLSPGLRLALSVLIALHVVAIFTGPWSGPPPASQISQAASDIFRPYLNATHQNHGYRFFAPDPGRVSHRLHYVLEMPDGARVEGWLPDRNEHWPRLFYHRHFMLAEFLASNYFGPEAPEEAHAVFRAYSKSYGQHLLAGAGARRVTLELTRRWIPSPEETLAGRKLDDPRSLDPAPLQLGVFERDAP